MLDPEERNPIRFYPRSGKPGDYQPGGLRTNGYLIQNSNGETFLDTAKLQRDVDMISERNGDSCKCSGECDCDHGNIDGSAPAGGSKASIDPTGLGNIAIGLGNIFNSFKKGENAQEVKARLKALKAQCPKKPLIRLTKAAKDRYQAHLSCMQMIADKEREIQLEATRSGREFAPEKISASGTDGNNNMMIAMWLGIGALFILLVIVIIILIRRSGKKKKLKKAD